MGCPFAEVTHRTRRANEPPPTNAVAIVDDRDLPPAGRLAAAVDQAGLWEVLQRVAEGRQPAQLRIVVKPEIAGFAVGSPAITDPALVEHLIDLLHDRGFGNVAVVGAADSSTLWAANRELHALCDLLGYRYETARQRGYDIVDLAEDQVTTAFPLESVLHGCGIAKGWLDADLRIVFSKGRTDETDAYALCLDTLTGVLPLIDKDLHYRRRRHPGDVAAALLDVAPVRFCIIDAITAAHGSGGRRAPAATDTGTIIAATDSVLADYVGALKMGLDPAVSAVFSRALRTHGLPRRYIVSGSLAAYPEWRNVPDTVRQASAMRRRTEWLDRLVEPWLQRLDAELFPLRQPLDARVNAVVAGFFADANNEWLLTMANMLIGWAGDVTEQYRTLFDKDALRRRSVPLGIDLAAIPDGAFDSLVEELGRLEALAAAAPQVSAELAWCYLDESVVFRYTRDLPIDFDLFVGRVDIARTIQFMNDYLGGVVVPLAHDASGRPVRQAERNLYLPQPNYLVLYQGQPIDVSKLEVVDYAADRQRLHWKTLFSENGSATYDDGIASFLRIAGGTRVTITGRQQFTLPRFFQVFDPANLPELKARLVSHAYQTFFDRTLANFEALVEGRDIRIGRPVDEPAAVPAEQLMPWLQQLAELAAPLLQQLAGTRSGDSTPHVDADGFVHGVALPSASDQQAWAGEIMRFIEGFSEAAQRDLMLGTAA
jgi:uncharacterized protein (DUF362 family)